MRIELPKDVKLIFSLLEGAGYEAYVVGGCVRDSLLGVKPKDWDITTNAHPDVVLSIFLSTHYTVLPTGIEYGTVTVVIGMEKYEVTTFRQDGKYEDGRKPVNVSFVGSLKGDIMRRDLTINSMAYNDRVGLVDYTNGYVDLMNKEIKFVGDARERLEEDTLRALRALRFWCRFDGNMSKELIELCYTHFVHNYKKLTIERVSMEIMSLFSCKNISVQKLDVIVSLLGNTVIPEILTMMNCTQNNDHHKYTVYYHTLYVMQGVSSAGDARLMFAALLHDIGKPVVKTTGADGKEHFIGHAKESVKIAKNIMIRLKLANLFISDVLSLVENHDNFNMHVKVTSIRKFMASITKTQLNRWKLLRKSDIEAQVYTTAKEENYKQVIALINEVEEDGTAIRLSDMKINGNDILALGIVDKRDIKYILQDCLNNCYGNPKCNNREWLLRYAQKLVNKYNKNTKI